MIIIENFGFSQSSFYFEKYFINMIGDALKLNQANKDELFKNIYQDDEKKLLRWAEKIKAKCPEYLTKFLDFTGLSNDLVTEEYDTDEALLERRMNLGSPWHHWTEVYNIFETITDMYPSTSSNGNIANQKINTFYDIFKGIKEVDTAYDRWQNQ